MVVNLSVDVRSVDIMRICTERNASYIDTCVEPWGGGYVDVNLAVTGRSNYVLRSQVLELKDYQQELGNFPTMISAHGANPGLVSHFLKQALLNVARDTDPNFSQVPKTKQEWAMLAKNLNIKVIHIAERDTQIPIVPKRRGEFVNTWSVDGFMGEGLQPAELGWGTHEKHIPEDGRQHPNGCGAAIYLEKPGVTTRVRTWTPLEGNFLGFLITHNEAISISDYFTVRNENNEVIYRPTCHYAYHPCDSAVMSVHELIGKNFETEPFKKRLLVEDILEGMDELGVLLCGHKNNAYWYGSQLTIEEAKRLAPYNSATSLQVTSSVLSGIIWALENPNRGVLEADDMDYERILEIGTPYLGNVVGVYTDWTPLHQREQLFPEDLDWEDPWQFKNIRLPR